MFDRKNIVSFNTLTQIAFWVVLFFFIGSISVAMIGWPQAMYRSVMILGCHLVNFYACYSWVVPRFYEQKKTGVAISLIILLLILITPVRVLIEDNYLTPLASQFPMEPSVRVGVILFTELGIASFASLLRLAGSREKAQGRVLELEKAHLEAELRFLKSQMSPHFLFNAINNIYSLALVKSDRAPDALMKLSELLRYLLYENQSQVTLTKEWYALESYMKLFQLKFQHALNITMECHVKNPDQLKIEPHLLIPLLENACKHSGIGLSEHAVIHFSIAEENGFLEVNLKNSKSDSITHHEPGGIGLENMRKRLASAYPEKHRFDVDDRADIFSVTLKIPIA